jgi:hypothetical protein
MADDPKEFEVSGEDLYKMLLSLHSKLDTVMKNQAEEKAKLTELELEMKNYIADNRKATVPLVPPEDVRLIFDTIRETLAGVFNVIEKEGILGFGLDFAKDYARASGQVNLKNYDRETKEFKRDMLQISNLLIYYPKNREDWIDVFHPVEELRDDIDYEEMMMIYNIPNSIEKCMKSKKSFIADAMYKFLFEFKMQDRIPEEINYLREKGLKKELGLERKERYRIIDDINLDLKIEDM